MEPKKKKEDTLRDKEKYEVGEDDNEVVKAVVHYCCKVTDVPPTYEDAISSKESHYWKKAMDEEIQALRDNDTYLLTPLPEGRTAVGGKWVYTVVKNSKPDI